MNARKLSTGLLTLALASGIGVVAHAQDGPPPPYDNQPQYGNQPPQYGNQDRGYGRDQNPGMDAGFHDGFENGRKDAYDHHTFVPERAFRRNGRPKFHEQFGNRRDLYRAYHDGFVRGYDRGYRGGEMNDRRDRDDRDRDDHHDRDDH